ncbi:uncharacterized mitochondrial protein AtMg00170/AtMg00620-like [Rutidosis leptorrhynchoides]|uniref:uncharacterized mitochondrial protein AtMg00170/AtMg00620-like n=1 Tax=Rutidosis leptorrhynchoides TaxID=125765 RepID=UPI003A992C03
MRNQSIMLCIPSNQSANHAILTFQASPSIPLMQHYINLVPYLDAYSSIDFPVMARICKILLFLFLLLGLFFLNGITATRQKAMLPTPPKKGVAFFHPKNASSTIRAQQAP